VLVNITLKHAYCFIFLLLNVQYFYTYLSICQHNSKKMARIYQFFFNSGWVPQIFRVVGPEQKIGTPTPFKLHEKFRVIS